MATDPEQRIKRKRMGHKTGKDQIAPRIPNPKQGKITGNPDPRRNNPDLKEDKELYEQFVNFYQKRGGPAKREFADIVQVLVDKSIENAGNFPFDLDRLQEIKEEIESIEEVDLTEEVGKSAVSEDQMKAVEMAIRQLLRAYYETNYYNANAAANLLADEFDIDIQRFI
jgi:hypothetical protein